MGTREILRWSFGLLAAIAGLSLLIILIITGDKRSAAIGALFLFALIPAAIAIAKAPADEEDWWNPIWTAPPLVGLYVFSCVVLTVTYLRRAILSDVAVVLVALFGACLVGCFLGFIFAIPRSLQHSEGGGGADDLYYAPNTNLEQISDWLTKIIVGISLVQYSQIVSGFDRAAAGMADSLGSQKDEFYCGAILLAYAVAGFFCAYVWTRLRFTRDLTSLERTVRDSGEYLEGLANAYLYQSAPMGYTKSLKLSERYLKKFGRDNDRVWLYIACGCGQTHRDKMLEYGDAPTKDQQADLEGLKVRALQALERVRDLAPGQYSIAHSLWDPSDSSEDGDDMRSFFAIPEFITFFFDWEQNRHVRAEQVNRG